MYFLLNIIIHINEKHRNKEKSSRFPEDSHNEGRIILTKFDGEISDDNTIKTGQNSKDLQKKNKIRPKKTNILKTKRYREKEESNQNEVSERNNQIDKKEYFEIMNKFSEEYKELGYDLESKSNEQSKMNIILSNLLIDLFSLTKFENSKPHKMIDYIIHNDRMFALSDIDKSSFEKIKKKVFSNKSYDVNNSSSAIFKSLYQYLKIDFSTSRIIKIFENINKIFNEVFLKNLSSSPNLTNPVSISNGNNNIIPPIQSNMINPEQEEEINSVKIEESFKQISNFTLPSFPEEDFENKQKDKFTYQKFISDKLKNYSTNCNIFDELNDSELFKSLIYICNKNYRNYPKTTIVSGKQNSKIEQEFIQNLNNNLLILEENIAKYEKINFKIKRLGRKLPSYNKLKTKLVNYTKKTFKELNYKKFDFNLLKQILELFSRYKEDDISTIHDKLKETFTELEVDKEDLRSIRLYMKLYFQLINMNERKLCINDEKLWKIINDYFKLNNYISPLKPKSKKKVTEASNEVTEIAENVQYKKKKNKTNEGEVSDKGENNIQKTKEKEGKHPTSIRNIFMVFKDVNTNDEAKSEESQTTKKDEIKKRKRKSKQEIKVEPVVEKDNENNIAINEQEIINKEKCSNIPLPIEVEPVKIPKPRKKRKPKNETLENQTQIKDENNEQLKEKDKIEEIKVPKQRKPRKKAEGKIEIKLDNIQTDIIIENEKKIVEPLEENDVKIENIPVDQNKVKKKGRRKKIKQNNEEDKEKNVVNLMNNDLIPIKMDEIMMNCKVENEPEKVKKPRKNNKNPTKSYETNTSNVINSSNLLGQQQIFFNNSLIDNFHVSNQFNNSTNTINNNINNNISINNNYNNPEIKNINIVYNGDLNNRLQIANLFSNSNLTFLNFDLMKNFSNTINPMSSINQTPNIESFFENNNDKYNELASVGNSDENIKIDSQSIPFLNIPLLIPVNELMNNNSQNLKYNSLFYNGFYQKIIDYNKNIAMKLSNEDIPINQIPNLQQKRKYTKKKNCDIEIYSSGENPNGINDINTNLQFPDLMISNDVLMEMKNQKSLNLAKKKKNKKSEDTDIRLIKEQDNKK